MRNVLLLIFFLCPPTRADDFTCALLENLIHDSVVFVSSQGNSPAFDHSGNGRFTEDTLRLRRHPERIVDCLVNEGNKNRQRLIISLQAFFEKVALYDQVAEWADRVGIRSLLNHVGLTALPSNERAILEERLHVNNERWDALEDRLSRVMSARRDLENTSRRISIRLFAYQATTTAAILGHLVYQGVVPEKYCTPTGMLALCSVIVTQSITASKVAWPRWRDYLLRVLAPKQFKKVVADLREVADLNPQQGLPYLLELATIHDQPTRPSLATYGSVSEQAARQAIIEAKSKESSAALVELSIRYIESGYLDVGIEVLDLVLQRQGDDDAKKLAEQVKLAVEDKSNFEKKLSSLKRKRIFWRVLGTAGLVGGASIGVSEYRVDPVWVATVQSTILSVASAIGMGKLVSYLWLRYPEEELRKQLDSEVEKLHESFAALVKLSPEMALPFLKGIASPDNVTHPFIREAALLAILDSNHPSVGDILEDLAQANVRVRGNLDVTERILRQAIERRRQCNRQIAAMGLSKTTSAQ